MTLFRKGRRFFSTAAIFMLLTAAAHTVGNLVARPDSDAEKQVFAAMGNLHFPFGLGMTPSLFDIYWDLTLTMSITLAALAILNLVLAASPEVPDRVLSRVAWTNLLWVTVFLALAWKQQIPPPLISAVVIELFVIGSIWALGRRAKTQRP